MSAIQIFALALLAVGVGMSIYNAWRPQRRTDDELLDAATWDAAGAPTNDAAREWCNRWGIPE